MENAQGLLDFQQTFINLSGLIYKRFSLKLFYIHGQLSIEQKKGIITLLPKKDKNGLFLKKWRFISLLNTDYKLMAKSFSNRLQEVLPFLIDSDQSAYLKDRFIRENVRLLQDLAFFSKENNLHGIILNIDFEKAFDSVNWNFMYRTLREFDFGDILINYFKTMYNNIESAVLNNGGSGKFIKLEPGVRQGCPLSAYLFITVIEALATHIRNNSNIKGIKIGNCEIKLSLLADDLNVFLYRL